MGIRITSMVLAGALAGGACSDRQRGGGGGGIELTWAFANGASCAENHVEEVMVRGGPTGTGSTVARVPCVDGSTSFGGDQAAAGTWTLEATALDGNGQTCFERDVEQLVIDTGDEPSLRIVFHRSEGRPSAACSDVGDDVDGGVPEPDAGGEGEGEWNWEPGLHLEDVGAPTWELRASLAVLPTPTTSFASTAEILNAILEPAHSFDANMVMYWGAAHAGFETELDAAFRAAGMLVEDDALTEDQIRDPSTILFAFTLLPTEDAPRGSSPDFANGPILSDAVYPITVDGDLVREGAVFDPDYEGRINGMEELGSPYQGFSHQFLLPWTNSTLGPAGIDLHGQYQLDVQILDSTGAGWRVLWGFEVQ